MRIIILNIISILLLLSIGDVYAQTTKDSLLARHDVLKIIVIDVEVGDATLIICPVENGRQDVILIDTGENDSDRIKEELIKNGIALTGKPISRFYITHYDKDHMGDASKLIPLSKIVYDHGDNIKKTYEESYLKMVRKPGVNRRIMKLDYKESFSGGVTFDCVAVNRATDFDPHIKPSHVSDDNHNSIALIITFDDFDYFTAGDLTFKSEKSLKKGVKNIDVYHVNHHGSSATSSDLGFLKKLDPEVSVASNGTRHGHPTAKVAIRLIEEIKSKFYQTNANKNKKAYRAGSKYVADDSFYKKNTKKEDAEGAKGTIRIVIDPLADKYYVIMPGLSLSEATFDIEK